MEKRIYNTPFTEIVSINLSASVLIGSNIDDDIPMPDPSHPGAPKRRVDVF